MEEFEGADWVLISDEVPVDEARRDELLENFQATYHGGDGRDVARGTPRPDDDPRRGRADDPEEDELHRPRSSARRVGA